MRCFFLLIVARSLLVGQPKMLDYILSMYSCQLPYTNHLSSIYYAFIRRKFLQ
jgi:hypothetical protein